jgi:ligand-binding sensor domain-containing protein
MPNFVKTYRLDCQRWFWMLIWVLPGVGTPAISQQLVFRSWPTYALGDQWRTRCMLQDQNGRLWLGGQDGLATFDGNQWLRIALPDTLDRIEVTALAEHEGMIWVGFADGQLGRIQPHRQRPTLTRWQPEEGTPKRRITALAAAPNGLLWIGTYGEGLYCYNGRRLYNFDVTDDYLPGDEVAALATDTLGHIWVATDGGLARCSLSKTGEKQVKIIENLPDVLITAVIYGPDHRIWAGTHDGGLARIAPRQATIEYADTPQNWPYGTVNGMSEAPGGGLWISTATHGVVHLENVEIPTLPRPQNLKVAGTAALLTDREGLLWVGSDKGGLWSANAHFGVLEGQFSEVQAILVHPPNRRWIGTAKGLYCQEGAKVTQLLPAANIMSLWCAPDGAIWAGTFGQGVYVLDGTTGRIIRHLREGKELPNGSVLSISGHAASVWLATLGGVVSVKTNTSGTWPIEVLPLGSNYVYRVLVDRRGNVWFGTDGKGVVLLEADRYRTIDTAAGIQIRTVYGLTEDRQGRIWWSTERSGLFCMDLKGHIRHWDTKSGLHSTRIVGIQAMPQQDMICVAYEQGIDWLDTETGHIAFFNAESGWPGGTTNLNALCADAAGHIWVGSRTGLVQVHPRTVHEAIDPQVRLRHVGVLLEDIDFESVSQFLYHQNHFEFEYQGVWLTQPNAVQYRYRLDGFDRDWHYTHDTRAVYPNLPPGPYVFRVEATEHGRFEGVPAAVYVFEVRPPWWATWWAVCLGLALFGGLLYGWIRLRERRLAREATSQRVQVEAQLSALRNQINPHFLFNSFNTLIAVIEENPSAAVAYVEHLADFYRSVMQYRTSDLIPLAEEITLVRNFDFLLRKRYERGFQTIVEISDTAKSYRIVPFALQMLVENAVKHNVITAARPLTVTIRTEQDKHGVSVVVTNNYQPKIKAEPGTQFGLASLRRRYELLGGQLIEVKATNDVFSVRVPLME